MQIDYDDLDGDLLQQFVNDAERIVIVSHEHAALNVDHSVVDAAAGASLIPAEAWATGRIICRPQNTPRQRGFIAIGRVHVVDDFALVPDVVAGGDDVGA